MEKILIYAAPFSYGPTGKALSLASHLKHHYDIDLAGYATSLELMMLDNISQSKTKLIPLSSDDLDEKTLSEYSLVISCSDLNLVLRAKRLGIKSVMFDSVFWWRSPKAEDISSIDAYVVQDFLGVDQAIDALKSKPENLHKVGAVIRNDLVSTNNSSNPSKRILISYGGIESPYIQVPRDSNYPFIITELLRPLFKDKFDFEFIVTGKRHVMEDLADKYKSFTNVRFETLEHKAFLSCIRNCDLVLATPGIETFYETVHLNKSSVLLLPHNSTQYLQLLALINAGIESPVCHYNYYVDTSRYRRHSNEDEEIRAVIDMFNCLSSSPNSLTSYQDNLFGLIERRLGHQDIYEDNKQQYLTKIGTDGGQSIVSIIDKLIAI